MFEQLSALRVTDVKKCGIRLQKAGVVGPAIATHPVHGELPLIWCEVPVSWVVNGRHQAQEYFTRVQAPM